MRIGYARVSSQDQTLALQEDALARAGCARVLADRAQGAGAPCPARGRLAEVLRPGDALVVWRLDRLGRSLGDLIAWAGWLAERDIALISLQESIDTTTPSGRLTFHVFGALAEFERNLIRERTRAGLAAARARGRRGGRPPALDAAGRARAVALYEAGALGVGEICRLMGISKPTLYAYVRAARAGRESPPPP